MAVLSGSRTMNYFDDGGYLLMTPFASKVQAKKSGQWLKGPPADLGAWR